MKGKTLNGGYRLTKKCPGSQLMEASRNTLNGYGVFLCFVFRDGLFHKMKSPGFLAGTLNFFG